MLATLARLFLPSWRFFDDEATGLVLKGRITFASGAPGTWMELLPPPNRRLHHVLWNPYGNRVLAACSLLERLTQDAAAGEDSPTFARTHQLVVHLVREELTLHEARGASPAAFEWRLCERTGAADELLMASGPHPW